MRSVIAASSSAHPTLVRAGLARGIPIFCEKPLAVDLPETRRLVEEIEASGIRFQLGFQRRFDAGYREARRLVESGELGRLYVLRLAGHDPEPPHEAYIPTSGGLFNDFSVHDFDVTRYLTGQEVVEVYADGDVLGFDDRSRSTTTSTRRWRPSGCRRERGRSCRARGTTRSATTSGTELFGSRDSVSVGLGPRTPMRSVEPGVPPPAGPAWKAFPERFADAYREELRAFLRVANGEEESACTARDGLEAVRVAVAATRSMREHRPVKVAEVE